jgi:hypothetical protein
MLLSIDQWPRTSAASWCSSAWLGGEVRDRVDDLLAGALTVQAAGVAHDPEDLGGAGEVDAVRRGDLDKAFAGAAVAAGSLPGRRRPVSGCDGGEQCRLVGLDGHHIPGVGVVQQPGGGVLGVQRIQGEHHPGGGCARPP